MKAAFVLIVSAFLLLGCTQNNPTRATPNPSAANPAAAVTATQNSGPTCAIYKNSQNGQMACFGCANGHCQEPMPGFVPYHAPPGSIGVPYGCSPAPNGCELVQ